MWQEELSRIINYNVEQECNSFLRKKIFDWQSQYQSEAIPIPQFPALLPDKAQVTKGGFSYLQQVSVNFMGRLTRELINLCDVRHTVYVESMQGWYAKDNSELTAKKQRAAASPDDDAADNREIVGIRTFSLLMRSIGIFGLTGMDKLICFMLVKELQDFTRLYRKVIINNKGCGELHPAPRQRVAPSDAVPHERRQAVRERPPQDQQAVAPLPRLHRPHRPVSTHPAADRQRAELQLQARLQAAQQHPRRVQLQPHQATCRCTTPGPTRPPTTPAAPPPSSATSASMLETSGINNPLTKIYITTQPLDHFPLIVFLFTLANLHHLHYNHRRATLENNRQSKVPMPIDGAPLIIGIITLLKQFHSVHLHTYLGYLGQYVRAHISSEAGTGGGGSSSGGGGKGAGQGAGVMKEEVGLVLLFLEEFVKFSHVSRKAIDAMLPSYIFDRSTMQSTEAKA